MSNSIDPKVVVEKRAARKMANEHKTYDLYNKEITREVPTLYILKENVRGTEGFDGKQNLVATLVWCKCDKLFANKKQWHDYFVNSVRKMARRICRKNLAMHHSIVEQDGYWNCVVDALMNNLAEKFIKDLRSYNIMPEFLITKQGIYTALVCLAEQNKRGFLPFHLVKENKTRFSFFEYGRPKPVFVIEKTNMKSAYMLRRFLQYAKLHKEIIESIESESMRKIAKFVASNFAAVRRCHVEKEILALYEKETRNDKE